jgi:Tol biopolymer transport system component
MPRVNLLVLLVIGAGCGSVGQKTDAGAGTGGATDGGAGGAGGSGGGTDSGSAADAPADSGTPAACNPMSAFGAPVVVPGLSSTTRDDGLSLSPDTLTAYFSSFRGTSGVVDNIYTASRAAADQTFGSIALITSVMGASGVDFAPRISPDGLRLYFASTRAGTNAHIFLAARTSLLTDFAPASQVAMVNSTADDRDEHVTADEKTIVFASTRTPTSGALDLWIAERPGTGSFGAPTRIAELATASNEFLPVLSDDKLTLYFGSDRTIAPAKGGNDIWVARRSTPTGTFGAAQNVAELNSAMDDYPEWLSPDGCTLYIASGPATATHFYQATRGR